MTESVTIENVAKVRRIIGQLAPEAKKALDKANRAEAAPLVNLAKSYVPDLPLSNWTSGRTAYDKATVQKGIKVKAGKRSRRSPWSAVTQLRNDSVAGSIYELAGTKSPDSVFARNLNAKFPFQGNVTRVIWQAVKNYPIRKYQEAVLKNYDDAVKIVQRQLDALRNPE